MREQPLFWEELPEIIVSFMGVPVAFAVQKLTERSMGSQSWFYDMLFLLWFYVLYLITSLVSFEGVARRIQEGALPPGEWDSCASLLFFLFLITSFISVFSIIKFGCTGTSRVECARLCLLCVLVFLAYSVLRPRMYNILSEIAERHPALRCMYCLFLFGFVLYAVIIPYVLLF